MSLSEQTIVTAGEVMGILSRFRDQLDRDQFREVPPEPHELAMLGEVLRGCRITSSYLAAHGVEGHERK